MFLCHYYISGIFIWYTILDDFMSFWKLEATLIVKIFEIVKPFVEPTTINSTFNFSEEK